MADLALFFLYSIEEAAASIFLGLALLGMRPGWKRILLMGLLQGLTVYIVRAVYAAFSIPLGTHMFFSLASYLIIIRIIGGANWGIAVAAGLISFISAALSETIMWPLILKYSSFTFEQIKNDPVLRIVAGYIGGSLMYILALVVGISKFSFARSSH